MSNETATFEVYVRPYPGPGGKWQISSGGGSEPRWSRTKPELFFSTAGNPGSQLMVVSYTTSGNSFTAQKPRSWSTARFANTNPIAPYGGYYALHPDGERVAAMPIPANAAAAGLRSLVFVFNFFDELRTRAPLPSRE